MSRLYLAFIQVTQVAFYVINFRHTELLFTFLLEDGSIGILKVRSI